MPTSSKEPNNEAPALGSTMSAVTMREEGAIAKIVSQDGETGAIGPIMENVFEKHTYVHLPLALSRD